MLHRQTTNQNSLSSSSTRHEPPPSTRPTSAELWRAFIAHARGFRGANLTVFENAEAKAAVRDRHQDQLWCSLDLKQLSVLPADFYEALTNQYPFAIGAVPIRQGAVNGVIIAFDSA
ncbi:unnamed protein product [Rhizopus microsporus]